MSFGYAWDLFHETPSRGDCSRWTAVVLVVCVFSAAGFQFLFVSFSFLPTHTAYGMYVSGGLSSFTSLLGMRLGRSRFGPFMAECVEAFII